MVRMSQWAVELPRHSAHMVHANKTLIARSKREFGCYCDGNRALRLISHSIYRPTRWVVRARDLSNRRSIADARGDGTAALQCRRFVRSSFAVEALAEPVVP